MPAEPVEPSPGPVAVPCRRDVGGERWCPLLPPGAPVSHLADALGLVTGLWRSGSGALGCRFRKPSTC